MKIQKPSVGRVIDVSVRGAGGVVKHRPGIVANDWADADGKANCRVFLDGHNDNDVSADPMTPLWLTSIHHSADGVIPPGHLASWRYPPRVTDEIDVDG